MQESPVYKKVAKCKHGNTSKLVGSESNEFAELLLTLTNLVLLDLLLSFVFEPLYHIFFNSQSFLHFLAA
jgi:hypothetical protein